MHQPTIETAFRRGSFGIETALNTPLPTSEAAQQFTELLNRPDRPIPSRRSSMRAMPNTFIPPPPPPPPASVPVVDPTRLSSSMRSPSPVDITTIRQPRRSPVRPPPLPSSPPRGNSSQAEHFTRLSPPNSASKRAYSFAREQALRPSVIGIGPRPPARTNSCPPDADIFKTRMMRSNSDGYTSASTSFVTEGSSSPTSSDSSQPSDNEDPNIKTNDHAFNLEVESRRLELVWRETEKQWKERYGITLPRSQEMAFRQHVEGGVRHEDDGPKEKEWRDMWKNTNASWSEFEARWRQDEAQKRRNDDTHFHTAHSDSRGMAFADDDKVMNTIFTHFEKEMEKRRLRAERKRLEEVQQTERDRRDRERPTWQATVDRESESRRSSGQGVGDRSENWLQDRLQERLRPDMNRTRSSSVVVESRPTFQRSRSGSVATIVDPLSTDAVPPPPPPPSSFVTPQIDTSHTRPKHKRSSRGSRESFGSVGTEEEAQRAEEHRAEEIKRHYMDGARRQHYTAAPTDNAWGSSARPDKPRHDQRPHPDSELPRVQEERSIPPTPHPDLRPSPSFTHDAPPLTPGLSPSIEEHLKILEREQAELARRIQELRAAAEGAKSPAPPAEPERGREKDKPKDKEREKPKGEPRAKSQGGRKHQEDEGGVFKAMQERLREAEGRRPPEKAPDAVRKPKRATLATLETEPTTPIRVPAGDADTSASRVHFASSKPSVEDLPSPTPPRVRTPGPGPRVMTPARVRTPSPRSQSPVGAPSIASSNATRDTASTNDIASTVHEAVARETPLKIQTTVIQPAPRPALKSRDTNAERPKSGTTSTLAVPHVNTSSSSPVESVHNDVSPMGAKTPRATTFDPDRTPRAQSGPVPEQADKAEPAPRVYISPNQARARAEGTGVRVEEETTKRRVDAAMGATVAAAAAEAFDRAGGKKRSKEAELRAQEERRASEEQLAREQRRAEEERKLREERRAEDVRRREAAERREREEQARYEREKRERERLERERQERERQDRERERQERDRQEERRRRWAEPAYERARPPIRENVADAWNSYELRWAALALPSSTQPITFRNIPWPMVGVPADPEAITAQAVGAFLLSPLHSQDKSRKERIRNAMLRWHSDKFEGRWMARIDEAEQPIIKEAVGAVARALTELMAKPDQY